MQNQHFFMVYLENSNTPTFKHSTLQGAEAEAKRLSREHKRKAYVLCTLKSIELNEFKETDLRPIDELPF